MAGNKNDLRRPSNHNTPEQLKEIQTAKHNNKMKAADPSLNVEPDSTWRELREEWASWTDEERSNRIFALVTKNGAKPRDIARLYAVKQGDITKFKEVIEQGVAKLKLKINEKQITSGLLSDVPMQSFHLGKQFAEQVSEPAHEGVESIEEDSKSISINIVTKESVAQSLEVAGSSIEDTSFPEGLTLQ